MAQDFLLQAEAYNLYPAAAPPFSNEILREIHEGKKNHLSKLHRNHMGFLSFFHYLAVSWLTAYHATPILQASPR